VISLDQITFVITTFKSEKVIFDCLSELPSVSPKIIVENSGNNILKINLENKFENLECFVMNQNVGYGKANNFGISKSKTNYIFIINPDAFFQKKN
jgi:N-acetylglucosaminyl-diphospho-decaprenol L-rhamnosyltransferase